MKNMYICSPSQAFSASKEKIEIGVKNLEKLGYSVTFSHHAFENNGNVSSSIENRLSDLLEGFTNPKYDIVAATIGGFNSNELLPLLDFTMLKKYKKPFVGMSDMTTLCVNLWQKAEIPTYYGANFEKLTLSENIKNYQYYPDVLRGSSFSGFLNNSIIEENIFRHGKMQGTLVGGNLALLCWMAGTRYQLQIPDNSILFLEDDEETNGYYWEMYLTHLKQLGYFDKVSGVIFGKVLPQTIFNEKSDYKTILRTVFEEYSFPILIDADFGHIDFPRTIPYGVEYSLEL